MPDSIEKGVVLAKLPLFFSKLAGHFAEDIQVKQHRDRQKDNEKIQYPFISTIHGPFHPPNQPSRQGKIEYQDDLIFIHFTSTGWSTIIISFTARLMFIEIRSVGKSLMSFPNGSSISSAISSMLTRM